MNYWRAPSKRLIMIVAISSIIGVAIMGLIVGLVTHTPPLILLWVELIAIGAASIGAYIGWLANKMIIKELSRKNKSTDTRDTRKPDLH
jgi:hypothetical protein